MNWQNFSKREKTKYKNKRQSLDGYSFQSQLEASVYCLLKLRMKAGEIKSIQVQDHVYLTEARILYIPDFKCTRPDDSFFWVEAKGIETPQWKIKKKLWSHYAEGDLEIWKGSAVRPVRVETITTVRK